LSIGHLLERDGGWEAYQYAPRRNVNTVELSRAKIGRVSDEADLKRAVVSAQGDAARALALDHDGRYEEAIAILDASIARFLGAPAPALREHVALALRNKLGALECLRREETSASVDEDMVTRCGEEALAMLDELGRGYSQTDGQEVLEMLLVILRARASVLCDIDRRDEAVRILSELITRYENDEHEDVRLSARVAWFEREMIFEECRPGGADLAPGLLYERVRDRMWADEAG
jgi:tetratricopeptide (TPR) repeat protein